MNWDEKQANPAEQFRGMLDQHMMAMRGVSGPMGMTGLPGRMVSLVLYIKRVNRKSVSCKERG